MNPKLSASAPRKTPPSRSGVAGAGDDNFIEPNRGQFAELVAMGIKLICFACPACVRGKQRLDTQG